MFFLNLALAVQGLFWICTNVRTIYFSSVKNAISILIRIALDLWTALGRMGILTVLILPIHKHGIFFPFICIIFHFFPQCLFLFLFFRPPSEFRSFTFLNLFILWYLALFDATATGIFLIFLFRWSVCICTRCLSVLYATTLLNPFISCDRILSILGESLGFSIHTIMSPVNSLTV